MSGPEAVAAISVARAVDTAPAPQMAEVQQPQLTDFRDMLAAGLNELEGRMNAANAIVRQFAVDDTVPVHQVTAALEEARLAIEIAVQLRARFVESYRDIMNMQV